MHRTLWGLLILTIVFCSCRRDKFIVDNGAGVNFSEDTIIFDTVFTTIGSVTKSVKVLNPYNASIRISSIRLAKGNQSMFRINVDGVPGAATDIEIRPKDSLYIFVEVTVDPNNGNNPLIVTDSIIFETNGLQQDIDLVAWGQDAIYYTPTNFVNGLPPYSCTDGNCSGANQVTTIWNNTKPIVIYGYLVVDSLDVLQINAGTQVHLHRNSGIWVYRYGQLIVNGAPGAPVVFQGDRLEHAYDEQPGQWDRIWVNDGPPGKDNVFNYAIIKNAFIGLQAETLPFSPLLPTTGNQLDLNNVFIRNCSGIGMLGRNYKVQANNTLITNCGQYSLALSGGGEYEFNHCTMANFWTESTRETPSLLMQNSYEDINGTLQIRDIVKAHFNNCIIEGNNEDNFELKIEEKAPGTIGYKFDHCILRTDTNTSDGSKYISLVKNPSTKIFADSLDYKLTSTSPARDAGSPSIISINPGVLSNDYLFLPRNTSSPDLGAIEY